MEQKRQGFTTEDGITALNDNRSIPLGRLSASSNNGLRRIVPQTETPKPPVAAFDSAL